MLVLTRKTAETIKIGDDIVVKVIKTGRGSMKIGIDAPSDVRVVRGELLGEQTQLAPFRLTEPIEGSVLSDQYPHVA